MHKGLCALYLRERTVSRNMTANTGNEAVSDCVHRLPCRVYGIVVQYFGQDARRGELGVHPPRRTQVDIAKYSADRCQVERVVIGIGLQERTVYVENDRLHCGAS